MTKKQLFELLQNVPDDREIHISADGATVHSVHGILIKNDEPLAGMTVLCAQSIFAHVEFVSDDDETAVRIPPSEVV